MTTNKIIFSGLVGVIIVLLAGIAYVVTNYLTGSPQEEVPDVVVDEVAARYNDYIQSIDVNEQLAGGIFLTTHERLPGKNVPLDDSGNLLPLKTYLYDPEANDIFEPDSLNPVQFLDVSVATDELLFTAPRSVFTSGSEADESRRIFHVDSEGESSEVAGGISESDTGLPIYHWRLPRWSSDGVHYLFSAQSLDEDGNFPNINDFEYWDIYVGNIRTGEVAHFADGYGAVWSGESTVLYMKEEGLYSKDFDSPLDSLSTSTEVRLLADPDGLAFETAHQLSPVYNNNYMAVSFPTGIRLGESYVRLYELNFEGESPSASVVHEIVLEGVNAFWPVLSPSGRYLSMQVDSIDPSRVADTKVIIYDLVSQEFVQEHPLDEYYFMFAFNTGWISADRVQTLFPGQ